MIEDIQEEEEQYQEEQKEEVIIQRGLEFLVQEDELESVSHVKEESSNLEMSADS